MPFGWLPVCVLYLCIKEGKKEREGEHGTRGSCILNITLITSKVTSLSGGLSSSPSVSGIAEIS